SCATTSRRYCCKYVIGRGYQAMTSDRKSSPLPPSCPRLSAAEKGATRMQSSRLPLSAIAVNLTCALMWALALPAPAAAQLLSHKDLTASIAMTIVQTAIETCKANGCAVSATVVGRNGANIVQVRGHNSALHTVENR